MNESFEHYFFEKTLIATRFAKATDSYHEQAVIQKKVSQQLLLCMQQQCNTTQFNRVFEIGCGTGNLTEAFAQHYDYQTLILNDLYEEVQQKVSVQDRVQWQIGDIEQLTLPGQLDLVMSSSALQWVNNLDHVLSQTVQALKPEGYFCFSSYGPQNFKEIKKLTGQGLHYLSLHQLQDKLTAHGFEVLFIEEQPQQLHFEHPRAVLKHIQATGVSATDGKFRWTKSSLHQFYLGYRQFITTDLFENLVYPLTYHPIFVIARRKT